MGQDWGRRGGGGREDSKILRASVLGCGGDRRVFCAIGCLQDIEDSLIQVANAAVGCEKWSSVFCFG